MSKLVADDFRDWTGDLRLTDGRTVTAIALRGDTLVAVPQGQTGNCEGFTFDRETGSSPDGQLAPEELYRVRPETYLRRGAGKAAYNAYAATVGVAYPYDQIPLDRRHLWGQAMIECATFTGRALYDEFCDLHCGNLQGHKFLCWSALRVDERAGWSAAATAGGAHVIGLRKAQRAPADLPEVGEAIRILNALIELDRPGVSAAMLARYPVNDAVADAPRVQVSTDGRLGWIGLLNALYPPLPDGRGAIMAITEESGTGDWVIKQFEPNMLPVGAVRLSLTKIEPAPMLDVKIDLAPKPSAPAPCLDPEKMNGFADQFPGTDDPSPTALPYPR